MGYVKFLNSTTAFPAEIKDRSETRITIVFTDLEEAVENTNGFEYAKDAAFTKILGRFPTFKTIYDIAGNEITFSNGEEPPVDPDHKKSIVEQMAEIVSAQEVIAAEQVELADKQLALSKTSKEHTDDIALNAGDITVAQEAIAEIYEMIVGGE